VGVGQLALGHHRCHDLAPAQPGGDAFDVAHRATRVRRASHHEGVGEPGPDVGHLLEPRVDALEEVLREPGQRAEAGRGAQHEPAGGEHVVEAGIGDVERPRRCPGVGHAGEDGVAQARGGAGA
jgi:hypothetical protein